MSAYKWEEDIDFSWMEDIKDLGESPEVIREDGGIKIVKMTESQNVKWREGCKKRFSILKEKGIRFSMKDTFGGFMPEINHNTSNPEYHTPAPKAQEKTKMETPIVIETELNEIQIEDGGCAMIVDGIPVHQDSDGNGVFITLTSWNDNKGHQFFENLISGKIRITIEKME